MPTTSIKLSGYMFFGLVILSAFWRVFSLSEPFVSWYNFSPLGAIALFSGAYLKGRWESYGFPLLILFLSDLAIMYFYYPTHSNGWLYDGWYWNYATFILCVLIGRAISIRVFSILLSSIGFALLHWLVVDFGVWISGGLDPTTGVPYTRDLAGLLKCYVLAIPFMKALLFGNLIYSAIFFSGLEWARIRSLKHITQKTQRPN